MKTEFFWLGLVVSLSSMAAPDLDVDGVPRVNMHGVIVHSSPNPKPNRYGIVPPGTRMIIVDGQQVPLQTFLNRYCIGKLTNETCARGRQIHNIDAVYGPVEKLPDGL
jgi:hypothetical protein